MRALPGLVHVDLPQFFDGHAKVVGNFAHVALGDEHTLRPAEATERSVGDCVCFCDAAADEDVWNLIDAVDVREGTLDDGAAEVLGVPAVAVDVGVEGLEFAVFVDGHFPSREEGVALARGDDIFVSVEHAADGSLGLFGGHGGDAGELE